MLVAVLDQKVDYLAERERELLAIARQRPTTTSSRWWRRSSAPLWS